MKTISQTKIAKAAGISPSTLANITQKRRRPSWPVSQRLELATGISAVLWIDGQVDREYLEKNYRPDKADQKTGRSSNDLNRKEIVNG